MKTTFRESTARMFTKALSLRLLATGTSVALIYIFTGQLGIAVTIGAIDLVLQFLLYLFHERTWEMVPWGRSVINPKENTKLTIVSKSKLRNAIEKEEYQKKKKEIIQPRRFTEYTYSLKSEDPFHPQN